MSMSYLPNQPAANAGSRQRRAATNAGLIVFRLITGMSKNWLWTHEIPGSTPKSRSIRSPIASSNSAL